MNRRRFLAFAPKLTAIAALPVLAGNAFAQEAGLTAKSITVGCSGALSGPLGAFGTDLQRGVKAAMTQINAKGGVQGRELRFNMVDDAYVPARTAENVKKMVSDSSVFALMSCIGTANNAAILPLVEEGNIPYIAPLTGATSLRRQDLRNVFHVRASYTDETQRLVQKLVNMGLKNIAVVYLDNPFGKEVLGDATRALQANAMTAVAQIALAVDGKNLNEVVTQVGQAKPSALILGTAGAASTGLIAALKRSSPMLPIAGLSVAVTSDGLKELGDAAQGLAITTVFPDPTRAKSALVRDFQAAMRANGAQTTQEFTYGAFEAYINTYVLAEGLTRAGRDLSRAKLRNSMASIRNLDLGGFVVNYSAAPFVGSRFVELGVMSKDGRFAG
jgi:branched-chain amino acid transport system substrate-binding protein